MIAGYVIKASLCETVKQFDHVKYITFDLISYRTKGIIKDMIFMKAN